MTIPEAAAAARHEDDGPEWRVLLVEHDLNDAADIKAGLGPAGPGSEVLQTEDLGAAKEVLREQSFDVILLSLTRADGTGFGKITALREAGGEIPIVAISHVDDPQVGQEAIRHGAHDYLVKSDALYAVLPRIVRYIVERNGMYRRNTALIKERDLIMHMMSTFLGLSDEAIVFLGIDMTIRLASPGFTSLVGRQIDELVGTHFADTFHPDCRAVLKTALAGSLSSRMSTWMPALKVLSASGTGVNGTGKAVPLADLAGDVHHLIVKLETTVTDKEKNEGSHARESDLKKKIRQKRGKVAAGRLQMIGLSRLKEELGEEAWSIYANVIGNLATRVIKAHLGRDDQYEKVSDEEHVICFASASEEEAASTVQAITGEILQTVLDQKQSLVSGEHELDPILVAEAAEARSETVTVELPEDALDSGTSIVSLVSRKMEQARGNLRRKATGMLNLIAENYRIRTVEAVGPKGTSTHIFFALPDQQSRTNIQRLLAATGPQAKTSAELDILHAGSVASFLAQEFDPSIWLMTIGLSYSTLSGPECWDQFSTVCGDLLGSLRTRISIVVRDIPRGTPPDRVAHCLRSLEPMSRVQGLDLSLSQLSSNEFSNLKVGMTTLRYPCIAPYAFAQHDDTYKSLKSKIQRTRVLITDVPGKERGERTLTMGARGFYLDPYII